MRPQNPKLAWTVLFALAALSLGFLTWKQHYIYWNETLQRVQIVDANMLHSTMPYALAFLEEHGREDLIQEMMNSNFGLFGMAYDRKGAIEPIMTQSDRTRYSADRSSLVNSSSSLVFALPQPVQVRASSPYDISVFSARDKQGEGLPAYGEFYVLKGTTRTFWETVFRAKNWQRLLPGGEPPSDYFVAVVINMAAILFLGLLALKGAQTSGEARRLREEQVEREREALALQIEAACAREALAENNYEQARQKSDELGKAVVRLQREGEASKEELARTEALALQAMEEAEVLRKDLCGEKARTERLLAERATDRDGTRATGRFRDTVCAVWPSLEVSPEAARQIEDSLYQKKKLGRVCHLISALEGVGGDLKRLQGIVGVEVKPLASVGHVSEIKAPPSRILVGTDGWKPTIESVILDKTEERMNRAVRYIKESRRARRL